MVKLFCLKPRRVGCPKLVEKLFHILIVNNFCNSFIIKELIVFKIFKNETTFLLTLDSLLVRISSFQALIRIKRQFLTNRTTSFAVLIK